MVITTKDGIYTPEAIISLKENEVFVFGSNRSGLHGAGAAKLAMDKFGAKYGHGEGLYGQSYALPTKSHYIRRTLSGIEIRNHFINFFRCANKHPELTFWLTKVGCGLAGMEPGIIKWWMMQALSICRWKYNFEPPSNIHYPRELADVPWTERPEDISTNDLNEDEEGKG